MSKRAAEDLAEKLQREVSEAQAAHSQYLSELAPTAAASRAARSAAEAVHPEVDEEPAMTVLTDTSLPEETRVEVLRRLASSISRRDEYIQALVAIVKDRNDSAAVRETALRVLGIAPFAAIAAGWLAAWVAKHTGVQLDQAHITAFIVATALSALGAAWKWLTGWQQHERLVAQGLAVPVGKQSSSRRGRPCLRQRSSPRLPELHCLRSGNAAIPRPSP
jgi:hypothetical protein